MIVAAVDVGTASARAGIFDAAGRLLGRAEAPLVIHESDEGHAEQSSAQIWQAVAAAIRAARAEAAADPDRIAGLAFDATCSLVLRDAGGRPLTASRTGDDARDTILWHDHRAAPEAAAMTAAGPDPVLDRMGGALSPEMQLPKLLWVKRHLPATWSRLGAAYDLADFLAHAATGSGARSHCTLACKWGYGAGAPDGWPDGFLDRVGLGDLRARACLPDRAAPVGADLGSLTSAAAAVLGLAPRTRVAAGLVDAHAGALGVLGPLDPADAGRHAALIGGTSSCVMTARAAPRFAPAIWGPHLGAILPGLWASEGGQSAAGALLDHLLRLHGLSVERPTHARVIARVGELRATEPDLAPRLHVLPDFHGNRAPHADPAALGVVSGLPLDASFDALCRLYWRTCVGLALGVRAILDHLAAHGVPTDVLHLAGGHARHPLLVELYADATGRPVVAPAAPDAVLLGTAMAAATVAGLHPSLAAAARAMGQGGTTRRPDPATAARVARDWRAFQLLRRHRAELDAVRA